MTANTQVMKQQTEMVYKTQAGLEIRINPEIVRNFLVQGKRELVTVQEIFYFMHICKARKLNPFVKDCYLIKYDSSPAAIVTSVDYFRKNARKADDCRGWKAGVIVQSKNEVEYREGTLVLPNETLLGGWASAQPDGWTERKKHSINLEPYIKKTNTGAITRFWKEERQPDMIMKVAETQLLRQIWGEESTGMYAPEEMPSMEDIDTTQGMAPIVGEVPKSDTVDRLKPGGGQPEETGQPEATGALRKDPDPDPDTKVQTGERERTNSGQFQKKTPDQSSADQEAAEDAGLDAEMQDGKPTSEPTIAPEWEKAKWYKMKSGDPKRGTGFANHVWKNIKTIPAALEGEIRKKWFNLYGKENIPFPKDVEPEKKTPPAALPPEPDPEPAKSENTATGEVYHDPDDIDVMPVIIKNVYTELAEMNGCLPVEVSPKVVNHRLKSLYPKAWEAARNQHNYAMIPGSEAAANIWNDTLAELVGKTGEAV